MKLPPGKVVLVLQPHHDDHTTDYGMGGLIARFVDEGYEVYYVRASNDEKDGSAKPAENDIINHRESVAATKVLGVKEVISLNWRNDYSGPIPLNELRTQLIFLIRKYKPDIVRGPRSLGALSEEPGSSQRGARHGRGLLAGRLLECESRAIETRCGSASGRVSVR